MDVSRQHVIDILHIAGLHGLADEVERTLPDPVEFDRAASFLARYGVDASELMSRRGGSP